MTFIFIAFKRECENNKPDKKYGFEIQLRDSGKWRFEHRWLEKNDVPDILKTAHNAMRFKLWGYLQLGFNKLLMLLEGNMNINSDQLSKTDYQEYDQEMNK